MFRFVNCTEMIAKMSDSDKEALYLSYPELKDVSEETLKNRQVPKRGTKDSAGYDLSTPYSFTVQPGEDKRIFFGWGLQPAEVENIMGIIVPRSSLYKKKGLITYFKCEQVVTGALTATVTNITENPVTVEADERIMQLILVDSHFRGETFKENDITFVQAASDKVKENLWTRNMPTEFTLFQSTEDVVLPPHTLTVVPTGVKWKIAENNVGIINIDANLSGLALANGIGIIDADYYDNSSNEGQVALLLLNVANLPITLKEGTVLGTGTVHRFYTVSEDVATDVREGGFGSTGG